MDEEETAKNASLKAKARLNQSNTTSSLSEKSKINATTVDVTEEISKDDKKPPGPKKESEPIVPEQG